MSRCTITTALNQPYEAAVEAGRAAFAALSKVN